MVDPVFITNYNLDDAGLEEYILFCVAVAGKNAIVVSTRLDKLLKSMHQEVGEKKWSPFHVISQFTVEQLKAKLKDAGIGCHGLKAKGFHVISKMGLDLWQCTTEELEKCPGIGYKTSRFFVLHTRENAQVGCLDTHILAWLNDLGYEVPNSSPQNKKEYRRVEEIFLQKARASRMSPAKLDLQIWRKYSGKPAALCEVW